MQVDTIATKKVPRRTIRLSTTVFVLAVENLHSAHQTVQVLWIMWLHPPNYSRLLPCLKLMITTHRITFCCAVKFSIVYLSNMACTRPLKSIPGIAGHPRGKTSLSLLKHPGQTLGNLQVKPCETPRDGAMLVYTPAAL